MSQEEKQPLTMQKQDTINAVQQLPICSEGFSTTLTWKGFDLNAVFGYSIGGKIYNYSRQEYDSDGTYTDRNQMKLKDGWNRWEKPGEYCHSSRCQI